MKRLTAHPEFADLVRSFEQSLSATELHKLELHLKECAECLNNMKKLKNFFALNETNMAEKVPPATTARLLNIFHPAKTAPKSGIRKHLRGVLIFDDWRPEFALNERLLFSDTRQMLFRAEQFEIDLRLNFVNEKCQVSGQIFPDCASGEVKIMGQDFTEKVSLNSFCEFAFPPVEEGIYDFSITINDNEIRLSRVSLTNQTGTTEIS